MEIEKHLVLSTAHIRFKTSQLLERWASDPAELQPLIVARTWYGWFVSTVEVEGEEAALIPEELAALQLYGREQDCRFLLLDCDGDEIEGLAIFPW